MSENKTENSEDNKETHITPGMVSLIKDFADAKAKDQEIVDNFRKRQAQAKEVWLRKSEEERQSLTTQGMEYRDIPDPPSKWVRNLRRKIRYRLFRVREGKEEFDQGLKQWMQLQFRAGMSWPKFTFTWDVSYEDPLKLIEPMEWDGDMVLDPFSKKKICDPAAFTNQEM